MTNSILKERLYEFLMTVDEYVTVPTAQRLAAELGITDFDVRDVEF